MDDKKFDPYRVIDEIVTTLVEDERNILGEVGGELVAENAKLGGDTYGFMIGGLRISHLQPAAQKGMRFRTIEEPLLKKGTEYLSDLKGYETKVKLLRQGLYTRCRDCKSMQEIRNAIPDLIKGAHSDIENLPRTEKEGWPTEDKPIQMFQFENLKGVCAYFLSARIFQ